MQRVLLVGRDHALREWCRLHLATQGLTVAAFDDARRALESARLEPPDLLVVDTDLQGTSAFALAAAMRSSARTALTPMLFLVSPNDSEGLAHALSIEPESAIAKPPSRTVLLQAVASRLTAAKDDATTVQHAAAPGEQAKAGSDEMHGTEWRASLLVEVKDASVLVVVIRNFVSLARALSNKTLGALLQRFVLAAREAVVEQNGWVVRAEATGLIAHFGEAPGDGPIHAARALEAALGVTLAARKVKRWSEGTAPRLSAELSIGCGVHTGEVIIARPSVGGQVGPSLAGQTVDLAYRLSGRAKGLGWGIAASEAALSLCGARFQFGRRASLTDTDHGVTVPIREVLGFNPGTAKPGEMLLMAETREAVLANTMLAGLAGDIDHAAAERTIMVPERRLSPDEPPPRIPDRQIERELSRRDFVKTFLAVHIPTGRREVLRTLRMGEAPAPFLERYLEDYRRIASLEQRNVLMVHDVRQDGNLAYVAGEFLPGGSLAEAIRRRMAIGETLNCLAQMCMAIDAVHRVSLVHGALKAEHFLFRDPRVLVLADFGVTERVGSSLGMAGFRRRYTSQGEVGDSAQSGAGCRPDFQALGVMLCAMLTGQDAPTALRAERAGVRELFDSTRLSLALSQLQPCVDRLIGIGDEEPFEAGEDVLVELLALKDLFPFDLVPAQAQRGRREQKPG